MTTHSRTGGPHGGRAVPDRHVAGVGATVLDIGGDVGALVLHTEAAMVGAEIEISPAGHPTRRLHVAVHRRPAGNASAAVFPQLVAGSYDLWDANDAVALRVQIVGGEITEAVWPKRPAVLD